MMPWRIHMKRVHILPYPSVIYLGFFSIDCGNDNHYTKLGEGYGNVFIFFILSLGFLFTIPIFHVFTFILIGVGICVNLLSSILYPLCFLVILVICMYSWSCCWSLQVVFMVEDHLCIGRSHTSMKPCTWQVLSLVSLVF